MSQSDLVGNPPGAASIDARRLVVVQDEFQACPYREGQTARMPLQLPIGNVSSTITDQLLADGFRRSGDFLYQARCPVCQACEPTRLEVTTFRLSGSMRRVLRRGDRDLVCRWGQPTADRQRVAMFNRHRKSRGLGRDERDIDAAAYRAFLVDSCCDTRELAVEWQGRLIAVAIVDFGRESMSAVYTHFDPGAARYSLGTYAILKQIEAAQQQQRKLLYLGMHVADNRHLNYKARFTPQQRLIDGQWVDFP